MRRRRDPDVDKGRYQVMTRARPSSRSAMKAFCLFAKKGSAHVYDAWEKFLPQLQADIFDGCESSGFDFVGVNVGGKSADNT